MSNWLKQNAWALIIAACTMVSVFTTLGQRVTALEAQAAVQQKSINKIGDTNVQLQISLATIQTDIEYIKIQVDKLTK